MAKYVVQGGKHHVYEQVNEGPKVKKTYGPGSIIELEDGNPALEAFPDRFTPYVPPKAPKEAPTDSTSDTAE